MASSASEPAPAYGIHRMTPVRLVVGGPFGVGKTTFISTVSETEPLRTEERLTMAGVGTDHLRGPEPKATTTVLLDFGRITLADQGLILLLYGTPGQQRFRFLWDDLTGGALGAVVLVDTRDLASGFDAVSYFESSPVPFVIAVNEFDGAGRYTADEIHHALQLDPGVPVLLCDARHPASARHVLHALVRHSLTLARARARVPHAGPDRKAHR
ncbi:ATP/GTP-binding protein [Streptomyces sp. NPDC059247]|uniref:GTP-binding protein n=1 Tax=Streptomyces sp. NPDC059247 TaxID=3346790 RepID=UPI003688D815